MLNKPKQGTAFRKDLMVIANCPMDYGDDAERKAAHPSLLGQTVIQEGQTHTSAEQMMVTLLRCRSVLDGDEGRTTQSVLRPKRRAHGWSVPLIPSGHAAWREPLEVW